MYIWNYNTQQLEKDIDIHDLPMRVAKFIVRKQWLICGSDDMVLRVYNYNTLERLKQWEAHQDYIRSIVVHPTHPYVLTSSDDMTIKLWDWEKNWSNTVTFEGHNHYVMQIVLNPKDGNMFASASLDRTIKVWGLGAATSYFTLEGHEKGVNCVDYFQGGDRPYLVSGADDRSVRVWDYQNKTCIHVLEGHTHNVTSVLFHPTLPIILSACEDNTVRVWHTSTYRLEKTLNYRMERVWTLSCHKESNKVAIGYDEGVALIKLGSEQPPVSMDASGKVIWAKHNEIKGVSLKSLGETEEDGERLLVSPKDLGTCEIYPQSLMHDAKGRFVVVCGDGEYIIYTALKWRNRAFGSGQEFVWAPGAGEYAVRENQSRVKLYKNFKERTTIRPNFSAEGIFGGPLLSIRSSSFICFYDWASGVCVRKIDVCPKDVFWSESGDMVTLACEDSFYILEYNASVVASVLNSGEEVDEEGIEGAFEVAQRFDEKVRTGTWAADCFIYTNNSNRLSYCVGSEVVTLAHLESSMYLLGYSAKHNRVFLMDKSYNIVSYRLHVSVINFQSAVLRRDMGEAEAIIPNIPHESRNRIAQFLEAQDLKEMALELSVDPEHKFDLAVELKLLRVAYDLAKEDESENKWHRLGDLALGASQFGLAEECMSKSQDFGGLLLLYSCTGNVPALSRLSQLAMSAGKSNIAFVALFLLQRVSDCIELLINTNRVPEAAFFARTYAPSEVPRIVQLWREDLKTVNKKAAEALADPEEFPNLFPDLEFSLQAEKIFKEKRRLLPGAAYNSMRNFLNSDFLVELKETGSLSTPFDGPGPAQKTILDNINVGVPAATSPSASDDAEVAVVDGNENDVDDDDLGLDEFEDEIDVKGLIENEPLAQPVATPVEKKEATDAPKPAVVEEKQAESAEEEEAEEEEEEEEVEEVEEEEEEKENKEEDTADSQVPSPQHEAKEPMKKNDSDEDLENLLGDDLAGDLGELGDLGDVGDLGDDVDDDDEAFLDEWK